MLITNNHAQAENYGYSFFLVAIDSLKKQSKMMTLVFLQAIGLLFAKKDEQEKFFKEI